MYCIMNKKYTKEIAPVIDIFPDLCGAPYNYKTIKNKIEALASLGFKRLYLVVSPPGYPMFSNPWLDLLRPENSAGNYATESLLAIGDPTFEHIYEAHRLGMEVYAIMKPYEGGGGYTIPHNKKSFINSRSIPCIGGERRGFDAFLRENPDLRVMRKPIKDYDMLVSQSIKTMVFTFCLDFVEEPIAIDQTIKYNEKSNDSIESLPLQGIKIWTSKDNGAYECLQGNFQITERFIEKKLFDANGTLLFEQPKRCREVEITDLNISTDIDYLAVSIEIDKEHRVMIPFSMIKAYGDKSEIPITCTPFVRCNAETVQNTDKQNTLNWFDATYPKTYENSKEAIEHFSENGFEFEWYGAGHWGKGWLDSSYYGIARGKMQYMKGTACEGYAEVQEYWLEQVKKLLAMGFDGIDIRLQNHSSMVSDYFSYGYNEPLVSKYLQEYGVDILKEEADPLKLMKIRGLFFEHFLEEAAQVIHSQHKKLQLHLRNALEQPKLSSAFGELGFWAMPKVLPNWEKMLELADEITIKDYNFGTYKNALSTQIKDKAYQLGKPLWIHCYIAQGADLSPAFFDEVEKDERVTGVLLYEMGHNPYANNPWNGLIEVQPHGKVIFNEVILEKIKSLL